MPIAAFADVAGEAMTLYGMIASADGGRLLREMVSGPAGDVAAAEQLGCKLADAIRSAGGDEILAGLEELEGDA